MNFGSLARAKSGEYFTKDSLLNKQELASGVKAQSLPCLYSTLERSLAQHPKHFGGLQNIFRKV